MHLSETHKTVDDDKQMSNAVNAGKESEVSNMNKESNAGKDVFMDDVDTVMIDTVTTALSLYEDSLIKYVYGLGVKYQDPYYISLSGVEEFSKRTHSLANAAKSSVDKVLINALDTLDKKYVNKVDYYTYN